MLELRRAETEAVQSLGGNDEVSKQHTSLVQVNKWSK